MNSNNNNNLLKIQQKKSILYKDKPDTAVNEVNKEILPVLPRVSTTIANLAILKPQVDEKTYINDDAAFGKSADSESKLNLKNMLFNFD